jgi:tRNA(Arg) A34 adenosine deaminase TadA
VIARDGRIVGEGGNRAVTRGDPAAHAELEAIRDAALRLGSPDLGGCTLYVAARPCPMCMAAACWARVSRVVIGETLADFGPPRMPQY